MRTPSIAMTSDLACQSESAMFKPLMYYVIPTWLDDTLAALRLSETVLSDSKKIDSILTADDIKFYNSNVSKLYELRERLDIPKDIHFSYLYETLHCNSPVCTDDVAGNGLGNSISVIEALSPFVRDFNPSDPVSIWGRVSRYSINKLENSYMIGIRFVSCDPSLANAEQAKENEKLAEFHIGEFGLQSFANTELFKKVIT